jgi:hypothetical protein
LPDLHVWRGLEPAVGLDDAVKGLDEREVLAEFVIDDDDLLVLIATRGSRAPDCRAYLTPLSRQTSPSASRMRSSRRRFAMWPRGERRRSS